MGVFFISMQHLYTSKVSISILQNWLLGDKQTLCLLFSSPEQSGSQGELIVYPCTGDRRFRRGPPFSNIFSEITRPIKAKFYLKPSQGGGTKVYINDSGHMTKRASSYTCVQNFKSLLQNQNPLTLKLVM